MASQSKVYARLTRNTAGLASYSSVWLASDHLLIVSSTGYSETYARIMLSDIKAFFVTPTGRRLWWGLVWGVIAGVSGVRVLMTFGYGGFPIASGIIFVLSAAASALNWTWGGGCRVQVMTGVQNTVLPALVRRKKTRAVLARLQPLIVAAQADRVAPRSEHVAAPIAAEAGPTAQPAESAPVPPTQSSPLP